MEDLTVSQVEVSASSFISPAAGHLRHSNSALRAQSPRLTASESSHPINDVLVRAQLRRQLSRLNSPETSPNSSFAHSSPSHSHGPRTPFPRPHRHWHRGMSRSEGRFCARLLAFTPAPASSTPPSRIAVPPSSTEEEETPLKATVVGCYDRADRAVEELRRAISMITPSSDSSSSGCNTASSERPRGASDTTARGFVWLDLHGVPFPAPSTADVPHGLGALWDYLGLSPAHREKLETVLKQHRGPFSAPGAAAVPVAAHTHRPHSDPQLHTTDADTFSDISIPNSSSSSSSSSDDDDEDGREGRVLDVIGLADLYDEQLDDVTDPDTVEVRPYQKPRTSVHADHYAMLQLAAQLEEDVSVVLVDADAAGQPNGRAGATPNVPERQEARPLVAEDGWSYEAATTNDDVDALTSAMPATTSASVFERHRSSMAVTNHSSLGWARALNTSLMALPNQHVLQQSFLGLMSAGSDSQVRRRSHVTLARAMGSGGGGGGGGGTRGQSLTPIVGLYVFCFPNLCVTWCPSSTLSLASETERRRGSRGGASAAAAAQNDSNNNNNNNNSTRIVQGWETLQQAVFMRVAAGVAPTKTAPPPVRADPLCTATFLSMLLTTVCSAYLPDTAAILSEVDAIDAMMPLIRPEHESDQADALRRVVLLRRKLSVHRRLLYQKIHLLEMLDRPVIHTLARFVIHVPHGLTAHRGKHANPLPMTAAAVSRAVRSIGGPLTSEVILQHGSTQLVGDVLSAAKDDTNVVQPLRASLVRVHAQLEGARVVIGNTTLIYSSSVARANSTTSTDSDFFQVKVSYISLIVMPLSALVSQFGMNCMVPGKHDAWPRTFTIVITLLVMVMLAGIGLPTVIRRVGHSNSLF